MGFGIVGWNAVGESDALDDMDIEGTERINASRAKVWAFVTDAESVASCTPGVKSVRILEPNKRF